MITPQSPPTLVGLAPEIISLIFSDISLSDIVHIRLQCTKLREIADDVLRRLYKKEIYTAALCDAFPPLTPYLERLARFRRRENAWTHFKPVILSPSSAEDKDNLVPKMVIRAIHGPKRPGYERMCDFNGGHFLVALSSPDNANAVAAIHYCRMPSRNQFPPSGGLSSAQVCVEKFHRLPWADQSALLSAGAREAYTYHRRQLGEADEDSEDEGTQDEQGENTAGSEAGLHALMNLQTASTLGYEENSDFVDDASTSTSSSSSSGSEPDAEEEDPDQMADLISNSRSGIDLGVHVGSTNGAAYTSSIGPNPGGSPEYTSSASSDSGEEDVMDYFDFDAFPADSSHNEQPFQSPKVEQVPWIPFPFVVDSQETILGFKLAVEESNLLALVTSYVNFLPYLPFPFMHSAKLIS